MSTAVAALPTSSDVNDWSPEEKALVEASGLVHTDARSGAQTLAERPVVAAFLRQCERTGLDPVARQIYCIARKSKGALKWQTQVSIDGARLVAERSGRYQGQTTPEFTADGVTWTQVWLSPQPPAAARVGVYREGFRDALYAVALWDAYVQTRDEWVGGSKTGNVIVSDMWVKMGPLMLAKCAEMLALRKAFPQDLSGLYSAEEMSQASAAPVRAEVVHVEPQQAPSVPDAPADAADAPIDAVLVDEKADLAQQFADQAVQVDSYERLRELFQAADSDGLLGTVVADGRSLKDVLWNRRSELAPS